jgi:hypothetical protein
VARGRARARLTFEAETPGAGQERLRECRVCRPPIQIADRETAIRRPADAIQREAVGKHEED